MKLLQKANRQLRVEDDIRADELIKAGYVELDKKTGKPIKGADTKNDKDLKKKLDELEKENQELREQLDALKSTAAPAGGAPDDKEGTK